MNKVVENDVKRQRRARRLSLLVRWWIRVKAVDQFENENSAITKRSQLRSLNWVSVVDQPELSQSLLRGAPSDQKETAKLWHGAAAAALGDV